MAEKRQSDNGLPYKPDAYDDDSRRHRSHVEGDVYDYMRNYDPEDSIPLADVKILLEYVAEDYRKLLAETTQLSSDTAAYLQTVRGNPKAEALRKRHEAIITPPEDS